MCSRANAAPEGHPEGIDKLVLMFLQTSSGSSIARTIGEDDESIFNTYENTVVGECTFDAKTNKRVLRTGESPELDFSVKVVGCEGDTAKQSGR